MTTDYDALSAEVIRKALIDAAYTLDLLVGFLEDGKVVELLYGYDHDTTIALGASVLKESAISALAATEEAMTHLRLHLYTEPE